MTEGGLRLSTEQQGKLCQVLTDLDPLDTEFRTLISKIDARLGKRSLRGNVAMGGSAADRAEELLRFADAKGYDGDKILDGVADFIPDFFKGRRFQLSINASEREPRDEKLEKLVWATGKFMEKPETTEEEESEDRVKLMDLVVSGIDRVPQVEKVEKLCQTWEKPALMLMLLDGLGVHGHDLLVSRLAQIELPALLKLGKDSKIEYKNVHLPDKGFASDPKLFRREMEKNLASLGLQDTLKVAPMMITMDLNDPPNPADRTSVKDPMAEAANEECIHFWHEYKIPREAEHPFILCLCRKISGTREPPLIRSRYWHRWSSHTRAKLQWLDDRTLPKFQLIQKMDVKTWYAEILGRESRGSDDLFIEGIYDQHKAVNLRVLREKLEPLLKRWYNKLKPPKALILRSPAT